MTFLRDLKMRLCDVFQKNIPEISVKELKVKMDQRADFLLLDVREISENDLAKIPGSKLIPLGEIEERLEELEPFKTKEVIVHCHFGGRSARAVTLLKNRGFKNPKNLKGGIDAWSRQIDATVRSY
jgi:sulfur-carrier protein adenylyltransferase/sulfurtransferase